MSEYRWARLLPSTSRGRWCPALIHDGQVYLASALLDVGPLPVERFELGPAIVLPTALRVDPDHRHRAVRQDEHEAAASNMIVRREFCECGAIRMARAPEGEFGPWLRA